MSTESIKVNERFISQPLGGLFVKTAMPIIFVMSMNGLLAVVDAMFLGYFVGADALGAVTLMFPVYMLLVALSTLVASGMSSILARRLGAGNYNDAQSVYIAAHALGLILCLLLMVMFLYVGQALVLLSADGDEFIAGMGYSYIRILIFCSPLLFMLSIQGDALRNEGRAGRMALISLIVSVSNIAFNYVFIVLLNMGVAGSAWGTVAAQILALCFVVRFRLTDSALLKLNAFFWQNLVNRSVAKEWSGILKLGAPQSLSFLGMALMSGLIIWSLQQVQTDIYTSTVSAYGIVTRIMTFSFLPLLGLSHALQSIAGNNYGAQVWKRSNGSLQIGMLAALIYCLCIQLTLFGYAESIATWFVSDQLVIQEVGRILRIMVLLYCVAGPVMMISAYFQAIGNAGRAALLGLTKIYLFGIPLTLLLPGWLGEQGIWFAGPVAELCLLILTSLVLFNTARSQGWRWGLFIASQKGAV